MNRPLEKSVSFLRQIFKKTTSAEPAPEEESTLPEFAPAHKEVALEPEPAPMFDDTPVPPAAKAGETTLVSEQKSHPAKAVHSMEVGFASHVGKVRARNEDSVLALSFATLGENPLPPFGLFVVADGMGGHSDGHKASQFAARLVANEVMRQVYPPFLGINGGEISKPVQGILEEALQSANWMVNTSNSESGTTLTVALVLGNRLYVAHVGDSRAYAILDGDSEAKLLTVDHSFVQRLRETGQISAEEATVHPQRNILYRAVGQGDRLDIDTFSRSLPRPGWLMLCSDGLWGVVRPEFILAIISSAATPQQACNELIEAALEAGGPDNISVIIARFE